jgi:hypothetical protein
VFAKTGLIQLSIICLLANNSAQTTANPIPIRRRAVQTGIQPPPRVTPKPIPFVRDTR